MKSDKDPFIKIGTRQKTSGCDHAVLWIGIRIGSVFRSFVVPDPYMLICQKIHDKSIKFKT